MQTTFKVHGVGRDPQGTHFFLRGTVLEGCILPGMTLSIELNDNVSVRLPVQAVSTLNYADREMVELAVQVEDAGEADFLEQFELAGETLVATSP